MTKRYFIFFIIIFLPSCIVNIPDSLSIEKKEHKLPIKLNYIIEIGVEKLFSSCGLDAALDGNIYIVDQGKNRIVKMDIKDYSLKDFSSISEKKLYYPVDIAIDSAMFIYVIDKGENVIYQYDLKGELIKLIKGNIDKFYSPGGLAIDEIGNIYLVDQGNDKILKLDCQGNIISEWGYWGHGKEQFNEPTKIAIAPSGEIYIVDTGNNRICKYDMYNNFILSFGEKGENDGQFSSPLGIDIDNFGNVFIADTKNNRIQFFDFNGNFLSSIKTSQEPVDICIGNNNRLFVSETNKIVEYEIIYQEK